MATDLSVRGLRSGRPGATLFACLLSVCLSCFMNPSATAQAYPNKPIRLIVAYPPAGGIDFVARVLGHTLGENLKQQVVIENRPGGAGLLGAIAAAKAVPDGYTIFAGDTRSLILNPVMERGQSYNPDKEFQVVALCAKFPMILVVNQRSEVKSVGEFIALARAQPGRMDYASPGVGGPHHLAMEMLKRRASIDLLHIPYKGAAPAVQDLIGGQVQAMFVDAPAGMSQIRAGKLRPLAVATEVRLAALPAIPTFADVGIDGFEAYAWVGIVVSLGVSRDIVALLNQEVARAVKSDAVSRRFMDAGVEPVVSTPEQYAQLIRSEGEKWGVIISALGLKRE